MNKKPKNSIKERAKRISPKTKLRIAIVEHLFIHLGGRPDIPKIADLMIPFIEMREKEAFEAGHKRAGSILKTDFTEKHINAEFEQWKQHKNQDGKETYTATNRRSQSKR